MVLESAARRGYFMSTLGANASDAFAKAARRHPHAGPRLGASLTPLVLVEKPPPSKFPADPNRPTAFALESTFEEAVSEAEYPTAAWWWRPPASARRQGGISALLYPVSECIDEHYSVYWDLA